MKTGAPNRETNRRFLEFLIRRAGIVAGLRRLPLLGPSLAWFGEKFVPRDTLTWIQVRKGPAAGLWMRVNPRTARGILDATAETEVQRAMQMHLRAGMTFYDLGANIGFFSLLGARLTGPSGRVVAFEADPTVAERLRENVARNAFPWVVVEERAVWSETRTVPFARVDPAQSPDRGLGHVAAEAAAATIPVEAVSLDDYSRAAPQPDFIKCDVEGAELEMFRGARRLFRVKRPILLCEIHSNENRGALQRELAALGYRSEDCDSSHILALPA